MAGTAITGVKEHGWKSEVRAIREEHNKVIADLEALRAAMAQGAAANQVIRGEGVGTGATLAVDANAEDTQMGNAIEVLINGIKYYLAAEDPVDISGKTINTDTITAAKWGVAWVSINTAGTVDVESPLTAQTVFASLVETLAEGWVNATNTLPPSADEVCIGHIALLESVGGGFVWGPDSISAETSEEFISYVGLPGIETAIATCVLDAGAATFTYGAGKVRLGSQALITMSGKANAVLPAKTVVASGAWGAWLIYALADDVEYALQVGATYTSAALAQAAIDAVQKSNPYMPVMVTLIVENKSGADFTPGTTFLDATGITSTFTITPISAEPALGTGSDMTAATVNA